MVNLPLVKGLKHPFIEISAGIKRRAIKKSFKEFIPEGDSSVIWLSLFMFCSSEPLLYINIKATRVLLGVLEKNFHRTFTALTSFELQLSHAIEAVLRRGLSWGNENRLKVNSPQKLLEFEQIWHPEYQRYSEHMFNHLIMIPLAILGSEKGKNYTQMALSNRVERLKQEGLAVLTEGFDSTVRNAISHGNTVFGIHSIQYVDKNDTKDISPSDFGELFDTLVETCHGLLVAIIIWVVRHWHELEQNNLALMPAGIRRLLLQGIVSYDGLFIESYLDASFPDKQANIYCKSTTRSRTVHLMEALTIANAVYVFGGSTYKRILIHIDCGAAVASLANFKVDALSKINKDGFSEKLVREAIEGSLFWHDTSKPVLKIWKWKNVVNLVWQEYKLDVISKWQEAGIKLWRTKYKIKHIENRSAGRVRRVHTEIALSSPADISKELIRGVLKNATNRIRRKWIPGDGLYPSALSIKKRPRYIWFRLHSGERPHRSLGRNGWRDPSVLAQGEWRGRLLRKKQPIFVKSPDEEYRGILIRYNPNMNIPEN